MSKVSCLSAILLLAAGPLPALAEKRLALVVGIDRYDNLSSERQLRNAVNDARAVAAALQRLGFDVRSVENVGRLQLNQTWAGFLNRVAPGDTVAFYFAGHGVEVAGANYLVPRDVPKLGGSEEELLKSESMGLARILDDLRARGPAVTLLILDACRNNPFGDGRGRSIGASRGLARVDPPRGTFVMYSAGAGQTALDRVSDADPSPNSVYTRTLLPMLAQPGRSLAEIAREVRARVRDLALEARHEQTPAYYDELVGDVYLAGAPSGTAARTTPPVAPPREPAAEAWAAVKDSRSCAVLDAFLGRYGSGFFADLARARQKELSCGQVAAAPPVVAAQPNPPPMRELARFQNAFLQAVVIQATTKPFPGYASPHRVALSVKLQNISPADYALAFQRGIGIDPALSLSSGDGCSVDQKAGLRGVADYEANLINAFTNIGAGEEIIVTYQFTCAGRSSPSWAVFTDRLYVSRGGRVSNLTISFANVAVQ